MADSTTDLTIEILKQIRDGVTGLREEMHTEIGALRDAVAQTNVRLGRVEQGLNDLGTFMRQIAATQARHDQWFVQAVEKDAEATKTRLTLIERRLDKLEPAR
jgi:hypothetical protein